MKKYIKWALLPITIVILFGGLVFGVDKLFSPSLSAAEETNSNSAENIKDNPTPEQKKIIEMPFDSSDKAVSSEISDKDAVLSTMHQMANTKIIAEDGLIWGLKAMTKERVENMKDGLKKTELDSDTKLVEMLDRWAKQDFSNCVEDHNYIWDHYLHGTVGKAVKLR
jgi:hypothetical protein